MIVRLGLSVLLAFAPAAQAAVVSGRIAAIPVGGLGLAPVDSAPQMPAPSLAEWSAPGLNAPLTVSIAPVTAAPRLKAPVTRVVPTALKSELPGGEPERAREIQARFDELKSAFDERKPEDVPVAPDAGQGERSALRPYSDHNSPPSPHEPPRPPQETHGKGPLGFSRPLAFFLLALIVAQVGIEAQTASLPPLIAKIFGNVSVAAEVGVVGSIADLVGTIIAPITAKKLGLKRGYLWSTGLRVVTGGLIAGLLAANLVNMTGLVTLFAVDYVLYGVSYTLEKSLPAVMLDQNQGKLEKFKAARQTAIEAVGAIMPIATGVLVAAAGFLPALLAFPVAMAAAMTLVALTLKLPAKVAAVNAVHLPGPQEDSISAYFKHLGRNAVLIARTPVLRYSLLAYAFVYAPTLILYWLLAPAFGLQMAANPALAVGYAGMISGLYSLGGVIAGVLTMRQQRKTPSLAVMRTSMLKWTAACAVAMSLFGALALPGLAWGTLTVPAFAMLAFAIPQIAARLKLESFFQSHAPKGAIDDATAVLEGSTAVVIAAGLWWFGKMLAGAHITNLFWLAAATAPLALPLLALVWALARASKPRP